VIAGKDFPREIVSNCAGGGPPHREPVPQTQKTASPAPQADRFRDFRTLIG